MVKEICSSIKEASRDRCGEPQKSQPARDLYLFFNRKRAAYRRDDCAQVRQFCSVSSLCFITSKRTKNGYCVLARLFLEMNGEWILPLWKPIPLFSQLEVERSIAVDAKEDETCRSHIHPEASGELPPSFHPLPAVSARPLCRLANRHRRFP